MRAALVKAAQILGIHSENWDAVTDTSLVRQIRRRIGDAFQERLAELTPDTYRSIIGDAEDTLNKRAQQMGVSLVPAAGVVAGELSGFGVYLATTTGLGAISSAIGVTFPWVMYQWATTLLGVMLGPIGWTLAGAGVVLGGIAFLTQLRRRNDMKLTTIVVALVIAIGDNPYEWFGFQETARLTEVKSAYRAMMKTFHPDRRPENLPNWVIEYFNQLLLATEEKYEQIEKHEAEQPL
jgi:hypothetical protein